MEAIEALEHLGSAEVVRLHALALDDADCSAITKALKLHHHLFPVITVCVRMVAVAFPPIFFCPRCTLPTFVRYARSSIFWVAKAAVRVQRTFWARLHHDLALLSNERTDAEATTKETFTAARAIIQVSAGILWTNIESVRSLVGSKGFHTFREVPRPL